MSDSEVETVATGDENLSGNAAIMAKRKTEANEAFKMWSLSKARYDRGLLLLSSISETRLEDDPDGTFTSLITSMVATDCTLSVLKKPSKHDKTLKKIFYSWSLSKITFRDILLTETEKSNFTEGYRVMFNEDSDKGTTTLPTVKYIKAKKASATDNAKIALRKALTPDQQASNKIWNREWKRQWILAANRIYKLAEKELSVDEDENGGDEEQKEAEKAEKAALGDDEQKEDEEQKQDDDVNDDDDDDFDIENEDDIKKVLGMNEKSISEVVGRRVTLNAWRNFLYKHGIGVMEKMLAEDEDNAKVKSEAEEKEKLLDAKRAYEGFVRVKDNLRIRMPEEPDRVIGGTYKPPRMDFSMGKGVVRAKKTAIPQNTVEMMRGSGLKYVHTLRKGKNGNKADLEKCQDELLNGGYVFKENMRADSDSDGEQDVDKKYKKEKRENRAIKIKQAADNSRKTGCKKSFDLWRTKKEMSEKAIKALHSCDQPALVEEHDGTDEAQEAWIEVGKALKKIDRNLYAEWVKWTDGFRSGYHCQVLWDYFPPKCCDIHSAAYSGMRDTFLKLLRPGLNFKKIFESNCRKKLYKWEQAVNDLDPDDWDQAFSKFASKELRTEDKLTKDEALERMELNHAEMKRVLQQLGLKMEKEQFRRLIDAFDVNGDGTVSKREFLSFVNPDNAEARPVVRGDTNAVLERKCIHESTCCFSGMPNAFVVTASDKKTKDETNVKILTRPDGSSRRIVTLPERGRRWEILKRYGVLEEKFMEKTLEELDESKKYKIPAQCEVAAWDSLALFEEADKKGKTGKKKSGNDSDDEYSDDESEEESQDKAVALRVKKAKAALDFLYDKSSENRAALTLKSMMEKGKPPPAPNLWCAEIGSDDVDDGLDVLTDRLPIKWNAQEGSLVAFFSLEMSGALGTKEQQNNEFREIFRDPPDADREPEFKFWKDRLQPNTTYSFRIRAFNGFGPGPYVRKDFTTQPIAPPTPVLVKAGANAVTIKWKFGSKTNQHFATLKKIFNTLKSDVDVAPLPRVDLLLHLEKKYPETLLFLRSAIINKDNISVFDAMESHDDENIYYGEIERYQELVQDDSSSSNVSFTRTKYVVERCTSQQDETYEQVWRGSAGEAMIKGLNPNVTYRFRVFAINFDGLRGLSSEHCVVNTLCETPSQVGLARKNAVTSSTVRISWPAEDLASTANRVAQVGGSRNENFDKILADWTKSGTSAEDSGLSLDMVFSQYDRDRSDRIDGSELLNLLQDLGVHPSEDRLREAWHELEDNGYVTFRKFEKWWNSKKITYVVKRTNCSDGTSVICYRGTSTDCDISGVEPNTAYEFSLKVVTPNSFSKYSAPVEVHTAPLAPQPPVVVSVNDKEVILKLFFGEGGGDIFILERKLIKSLMQTRSNKLQIKKAQDEGWVTVFKGSDPLVKSINLIPNCIYQYRARAANVKDLKGPVSEPIALTTMESKMTLRATNAPEVFTIECTRDVVVGDLILFTERLFLKDGKVVLGGGNGMSMTKSGGVATPRLSVSSSAGSLRGKLKGKEKEIEFAGERTVAARVLSKRSGGNKKYVRMAVQWSSVSDRKRCGDLVLKEGLIVERNEADVFSFETFRSAWEDESHRDD
ncbi:hypothetical protein TrVE_jg3561 [Triparma verrucosa]|uniref:Calmodulin n=1 Tax=Triparma verrucosa TaxID=1606542 RepID=A0A9W7F7I5_9STRA|nr:hypothetical protein TrVE_jg3561 [Triparma verrucosa]